MSGFDRLVVDTTASLGLALLSFSFVQRTLFLTTILIFIQEIEARKDKNKVALPQQLTTSLDSLKEAVAARVNK